MSGRGKQVRFSQKLVDEICDRLVEGESTRAICRDAGMPAMSTVFRWLNQYPEFAAQYGRAKAEQADVLVGEMVEIADRCVMGERVKLGKDGEVVEVIRADMVDRAKLQIDTRKWVAARLQPRKYGELVKAQLGAEVGEGVRLEVVTGVPGDEDGG